MKLFTAVQSKDLRLSVRKVKEVKMRHLQMYGVCVRTSLSEALAYRVDFILSSIITILSNILFPLVTILIYANGASFPGWTMWEVLLIQSVYSMANGIASMVLGGVLWVPMAHIRSGSFATVLLKPVSPLFYLVASTFDISSISIFLSSLVITIVAASFTGIAGITGILSFLLLFIAGIMVICGLNLIMAAISFKWVGNSRIPEIFSSVSTFGTYPIGIFPKAVKVITTMLIPVAMIGFFPASALLGRLDPKAFITLVPCVLFLLFGIWLYNKMIKLYEGVGG